MKFLRVLRLISSSSLRGNLSQIAFNLWRDLNLRPQHYESAGPKINFNKNSILEFKKVLCSIEVVKSVTLLIFNYRTQTVCLNTVFGSRVISTHVASGFIRRTTLNLSGVTDMRIWLPHTYFRLTPNGSHC